MESSQSVLSNQYSIILSYSIYTHYVSLELISLFDIFCHIITFVL